MRQALAGGAVTAGDVGYVNAHGTGTKLGDIAEITALTDVFGEDYRRYRSGVGMLVPRFRRRSA